MAEAVQVLSSTWGEVTCSRLMPLLRAAAQVLQKNPLLIRHAQENDTPVGCKAAARLPGCCCCSRTSHTAPVTTSIKVLSCVCLQHVQHVQHVVPEPAPCQIYACICPPKGMRTRALRAACCLPTPCPLPVPHPQFEPVYMDADGNWMAPSLNYMEKRTDWQAYIDKNVFKQE